MLQYRLEKLAQRSATDMNSPKSEKLLYVNGAECTRFQPRGKNTAYNKTVNGEPTETAARLDRIQSSSRRLETIPSMAAQRLSREEVFHWRKLEVHSHTQRAL